MKKTKVQARLKHLSDAFTGPPAPVERNPASYDQGGGSFMHGGSCPGCGHVNKDIDASANGKEITCAKCGKVYTSNYNLSTAPGEEFLTEPGRFAMLKKAIEKLGQRERRGPAQFTDLGETVYDKLYTILEEITAAVELESTEKEQKEFETNLESAKTRIDEVQIIASALADIVDAADEESELKGLTEDVGNIYAGLLSLEEFFGNLGYIDIPWETPVNVDEITSNIAQLLDEIKQVGIDSKGGVTSPIDIGDWLY